MAYGVARRRFGDHKCALKYRTHDDEVTSVPEGSARRSARKEGY